MKHLLSFIIILHVSLMVYGTGNNGNVSQTVRGTIIDTDSKSPIIGATIVLLDSNLLKGTVSDPDGHFELKAVPVGRVSLKISSIGYEVKYLNNISVSSGRESFLQVELTELLVQIDEITITQKKHKSEVLNEMALISARAFSVEETERYAGSLNDPARMASSFAGVLNDPEGNNSIVVRGNSSGGVQWRLEGVEIPNPNHFAEEGMTGGPINALNSDMLANSDFFTGAFAPEYGNAYSAVFDMRLRIGNTEKKEYSASISGIGLDATAEGPLSIGKNASYVANYRYSSIALLSDLGIVDFGGIPKYQDLSYKVNIPTNRFGTFTFFGLGGYSHISDNWDNYYDDDTITNRDVYKSWLGVSGLNHTYFYSNNIFQHTSVVMSTSGSGYLGETLDQESNNYDWDNEDLWYRTDYKLATKLNLKLNANHLLQVGGEYTFSDYKFESFWINDDTGIKEKYLDNSGNTDRAQSYISWKYRINNEITMVSGIHGTYAKLSNELIAEPRLALSWQIKPKHTINAGYGAHSHQNPMPVVFLTNTYYDTLSNGNVRIREEQPNLKLELPRAHHFVLGYNYRINRNMNAKFEVYYQHLYNIGTGTGADSVFSLLTNDGIWSDVALVNNGKGRNYGLEFTLERYFVDNYYFMLTASLYQSLYTDINGVERNTRYNGNYATNLLIGKEYKIGDPDKNRTLAVNTRITYIGGRKYIPLNMEASIAEDRTVRNYNEAYKDKLDNIFQLNLGISLRRNRELSTHELRADLQNATNNQARINEYYAGEGEFWYGTQLGIIPNLIYRIYF